MQGINDRKMMSSDDLSNLIVNLATYLDCIGLENSSPAWPAILTQFDVFFRRLLLMMSSMSNTFEMDSILKMMIGVLKIPGLAAAKVWSSLYTLLLVVHAVATMLTLLWPQQVIFSVYSLI